MFRLTKLLAGICVTAAQEKGGRRCFPLQNYSASESAPCRMIHSKTSGLLYPMFIEQAVVIDERYPISTRVSYAAYARCGQPLSVLMDHP